MKQAAVFLLSLCLAGCFFDYFPDPRSRSLTGRTWVLQAITSADSVVFVSPSDTLYRIRFTDDGRVEGRDHCNRCEGTYALSPAGNGSIRLFVHCTEMGCGGGYRLPVPDMAYGAVLVTTSTFHVQGRQLRMLATDLGGNRLVLHHTQGP